MFKSPYKLGLLVFVAALLIFGGNFFLKKPIVEAPAPVLEKGEYKDLIRINTPVLGAEVGSPIMISGEARGTWYFEASFPIYVVDWDGKIIGQGIATAQGDWMTEDYVPFTASIIFDNKAISGNYSNRGAIIFRKDNPSGLPQFDDAYEMPILLK